MKSIYFPAPVADKMVRAILDGRKTVTRRVVKPQPKDGHRVLCGPLHKKANTVGFDCGWKDDDPRTGYIETVKLPHSPGDILYVRETWTVWNGNYEYKADVDDGYGPFCSNCTLDICAGDCNSILKWHPSIHMPREAARIFLRVTDVRVERLQGIGHEGIAKEGIVTKGTLGSPERINPFYAFKKLWDSTIRPANRAIYGWEANPWVWVIAFERTLSADTAWKKTTW